MTYHYTGAVAWDVLGTSVRIAGGLRSLTVIDPATLAIPTNLVQAGVAVSWITVDSRGRYSFQCDPPSVVVDFGAGPWDLAADEVPAMTAAFAVSSDSATATIFGNPATASRVVTDALYPPIAIKPLAPAATGTDLTALQAFLTANTGKSVALRQGAAYTISGTLNVGAGTRIDCQNATITQAANLTPIFTATAIDGFTVRDGRFVGKTTDYADTTATYPSAVIRATTGSKNIRLLDCDVRGFAGPAVYASGVTGLVVSGNKIIGVGNGGGAGTYVFVAAVSKDNAGIIMDGATATTWITDNDISWTCQGILGGLGTDIHINENQIHDIGGQHGIYLNNTLGLHITGNIIRRTAAQGIKIQLSTPGNGDCTDVIISENIVNTVVGSAVHLVVGSTSGTDRFRRVKVIDNVGYGTADGITVQLADGFEVRGNTVRSCTGAGVRVEDCVNGVVADNHTRDTANQGVMVNGSVTIAVIPGANIRVARNRMMEPATANGSTSEFGISTSGCSDMRFEDNWITDANGNMRYGIYVAGGTQTTMDFIDNRVTGATDYGFRGVASTACRAFRGNSFSGTLGPILNLPTGFAAIAAPTAPSAAYVQAEAASMKTAMDAIRAVLTANNLTV